MGDCAPSASGGFGGHTIPIHEVGVPVIRLAAAALAGLLVMLGFPPFEWTVPSWVGIVAVVWLLTTAPSSRHARWSAYVFSVAFFGSLLWWLSEVELIAFYPMILLQALPMLIVGTGIYRYRQAPPFVFVVAVAGSVGLAEYVRVRWPYGGFPWGSPGLTVSSTPFRASAQWIGGSGWTVLLFAAAALLVLVIQRRLAVKVLAGGVMTMAAFGLVGNVWPAVPHGQEVGVTIVQGNSPCPGSRCPNERTLIFESHLALTEVLEPATTDLVVWPESSTGSATDPVQHPEFGQLIGAQALRLGAVFVVGGDRDAGPENFINANVFFDEAGVIVDEYRKRHPVPFGEYVPLRGLLDWIPALDRIPRDLLQGDDIVLMEAAGVPFGSVISYEGAFARYERDTIRAGAEFLVVATNEASFGDTPSSDQFLAISRLRAAEFGIDIVHAAVTGSSAIVRADGSVDGLTDLYETALIQDSVRARSAGHTLYAQWGDWFQVIWSIAFLGLWVAERLNLVEPVPLVGASK